MHPPSTALMNCLGRSRDRGERGESVIDELSMGQAWHAGGGAGSSPGRSTRPPTPIRTITSTYHLITAHAHDHAIKSFSENQHQLKKPSPHYQDSAGTIALARQGHACRRCELYTCVGLIVSK